MSNHDLVINPSGTPSFQAATKITPSYVVAFEGKKTNLFIATKFDDIGNNAKFVGFYCDKTINEIALKYNEIIKDTDISSFIEVIFPWVRIEYVRSLMYKHKPSK